MEVFTETKRLILRELVPSDVQGMYELDSNPEVHKYLGNKPAKSEEESLEAINSIRSQHADFGIGRWAVIEKESNDFVGWAGLKFVTEKTNNHRNFYDLGYRFIQKHWGQGFATEAAMATIEYAFFILDIEEIYAIATCNNEASNYILKKIGMEYIEEFDLNGEKYNWYKIEKSVLEMKMHGDD